MKKSSIIVACISIILFGLFLCCGLTAKNKCMYSREGLDIKAGEYEKIIAEGIKLKPGIYRISIDYSCHTDQSDMYIAYLTPRDKSIGKSDLKSTGGYIYLNKNTETQEFYLYEKTNGLYLELTAYYDDFNIESIYIIDTGKRWFCYSFISLCIGLVTIMLILFSEKIKSEENREKVFCFIAFFGIWIISSMPLLCGNTVLTADGPYHMERVEGVANALRAGIFPVRIEPTWLQDYGYGNGLFYCDVFLMFPALLRIIGFSVTTSYNAYLLAVNAFIIFASYYTFVRIVKKEYIAMLMTAMYSVSEIKYYQFIHKGTLGEGTALIFLPLVLLGLYEILYVDNDKSEEEFVNGSEGKNILRGWIWLAVGYSGLISSHILSTEITILVTIIILLLNVKRLFKKGVITDLLKSAGTAFLLTAWFVIPFIESYLLEDVNIKHSFSRRIQNEGLSLLQLAVNFLGNKAQADTDGIYGYEPVGLGIHILMAIVLFAIILAIGIIKKKGCAKDFRFKISVYITAILLIVFSLRFFPWDWIQNKFGFLAPLISSIQFPRRFLEWGTLLCIVIVGAVLEYLQVLEKKRLYIVTITLMIICMFFSLVSRQDYDVATKLKYPLGNFEGIRTDYVAGGEYVLHGTDIGKLEYNKVSASDGIIYSDYKNGCLKGEITVNNPCDSEGYIEYPLLNYRHYYAKDSQGKKFSITNGDNNLVRVIIPPDYSGRILVKYKEPFYWRLAEMVSLLSVFMLAVMVLRKKYIKKKAQNKACDSI